MTPGGTGAGGQGGHQPMDCILSGSLLSLALPEPRLPAQQSVTAARWGEACRRTYTGMFGHQNVPRLFT